MTVHITDHFESINDHYIHLIILIVTLIQLMLPILGNYGGNYRVVHNKCQWIKEPNIFFV